MGICIENLHIWVHCVPPHCECPELRFQERTLNQSEIAIQPSWHFWSTATHSLKGNCLWEGEPFFGRKTLPGLYEQPQGQDDSFRTWLYNYMSECPLDTVTCAVRMVSESCWPIGHSGSFLKSHHSFRLMSRSMISWTVIWFLHQILIVYKCSSEKEDGR